MDDARAIVRKWISFRAQGWHFVQCWACARLCPEGLDQHLEFHVQQLGEGGINAVETLAHFLQQDKQLTYLNAVRLAHLEIVR